MTRSMVGALLVVASMFAVSCSDGSEAVEEKTFPLCAPHSFRLTGTIDDKAIDITESGDGGGVSQDDAGGEFLYPAGLPEPEEELTDLSFFWDHGVLNGHVSPATGTLRMATGPFAGQTMCAGEGTQFRIPEDETQGIIQFRLAGLSGGEACTAVLTGTVQGCVRWE